MPSIFHNSDIQKLLQTYSFKKREYEEKGIYKYPFEIMEEIKEEFKDILKEE